MLGPDSPTNINRNRFSGVGFYSLYIPKTVPASLRALKYATNLAKLQKLYFWIRLLRIVIGMKETYY